MCFLPSSFYVFLCSSRTTHDAPKVFKLAHVFYDFAIQHDVVVLMSVDSHGLRFADIYLQACTLSSRVKLVQLFLGILQSVRGQHADIIGEVQVFKPFNKCPSDLPGSAKSCLGDPIDAFTLLLTPNFSSCKLRDI